MPYLKKKRSHLLNLDLEAREKKINAIWLYTHKKGLFYVLWITHQSCHLTSLQMHSSYFTVIIFSSPSNIFTSVGGVNWRATNISSQTNTWSACVSLWRELEENEAFDTSKLAKLSAACHGRLFKKQPFFSSTCNITSPHLSRLGDAPRRGWRCVSVCMC